MNRDWLITGLNFTVLLFLQVFIFDAIYIGIYFNLQIYLMFILFLPISFQNLAVLFLSAVTGLAVDIFSGTLGLNMAACTAIGYARYHVLKYTSANDIVQEIPSIGHHFQKYFIYTGTLILLHHLILFFLDAFSIKDALNILIRTILSAVANFILIALARAITNR
ncbi:MAG: rod shape-determining protein MreD [Prevotellaceae bacterium]|jgi:rod shape-determining protein MreD|nr:rod shape-determining protein MreD [Prevotellaceae bacterium]